MNNVSVSATHFYRSHLGHAHLNTRPPLGVCHILKDSLTLVLVGILQFFGKLLNVLDERGIGLTAGECRVAEQVRNKLGGIPKPTVDNFLHDAALGVAQVARYGDLKKLPLRVGASELINTF